MTSGILCLLKLSDHHLLSAEQSGTISLWSLADKKLIKKWQAHSSAMYNRSLVPVSQEQFLSRAKDK